MVRRVGEEKNEVVRDEKVRKWPRKETEREIKSKPVKTLDDNTL